MTARSPSGPNQWIEHKLFQPGRNVLAAEPFKIMDDQEWLLLKGEMIFSCYIGRLVAGGAGFVQITTTGFALPCKPTDRCDYDSSTVMACTAYAQIRIPADITGDTYEVKFTSAGTGSSVTLSDDGSSPSSYPSSKWLSGSLNLECHGTTDSVSIQGQCTTGAQDLFVNAVAIYADSEL